MSIRGGIQFQIGSTWPISADSDEYEWLGGKGSFLVKATGAGTVTLQVKLPDETTFLAVGSDTTIATTTGGGNFELPRCRLKVAVSGFTNVYARAASTE